MRKPNLARHPSKLHPHALHSLRHFPPRPQPRHRNRREIVLRKSHRQTFPFLSLKPKSQVSSPDLKPVGPLSGFLSNRASKGPAPLAQHLKPKAPARPWRRKSLALKSPWHWRPPSATKTNDVKIATRHPATHRATSASNQTRQDGSSSQVFAEVVGPLQGALDLRGNVEKRPASWRLEPKFLAIRLHAFLLGAQL
jgi:hypothetical protein